MLKPIILIGLVTACGGSGGGGSQTTAASTATQTATATETATATQTVTATATSTSTTTTLKVTDIATALSQAVLGKAVSDQAPAVQALVENPAVKLTKLSIDVCQKSAVNTTYSSGGQWYSDGTDKIFYDLFLRDGVVHSIEYQVNDREAISKTEPCP